MKITTFNMVYKAFPSIWMNIGRTLRNCIAWLPSIIIRLRHDGRVAKVYHPRPSDLVVWISLRENWHLQSANSDIFARGAELRSEHPELRSETYTLICLYALMRKKRKFLTPPDPWLIIRVHSYDQYIFSHHHAPFDYRHNSLPDCFANMRLRHRQMVYQCLTWNWEWANLCMQYLKMWLWNTFVPVCAALWKAYFLLWLWVHLETST